VTFSNRKNILRRAKKNIEDTRQEELEKLLIERDSFLVKMEQSEDDFRTEIATINAKIQQISIENYEWNLSKSNKKKKSIEWDKNFSRGQMRSTKRKKIDWEVAQGVIDTRKSIRKNNTLWLDEGSLVVHKDKRDCPMIVIDIGDGRYTRVLNGGEVQHYRTLSLRPALSD
jgi:hypothetical protein